MVEALTLAGVRDPDHPPGTLQAHEPATVWRGAGPAGAGQRGQARGTLAGALAVRPAAQAVVQEGPM